MDQLRGYAIFGMIFVNFLDFPWVPHGIEHSRTNFSYADTIAPLFVFVVGMGFRLSMLGRAAKFGPSSARLAALKRYAILFIVAIMFYGPSYRVDWWDALTHIALAGMLTLPFIDRKMGVRVAAACGFLLLYTLVMFGTGYSAWLRESSMNGGPLGTLGYCFTLLFGTIAYDLLASRDQRRILIWAGGFAVALIGLAFVAWAVIPYERLEAYSSLGSAWPFAKRWSEMPFILLSTGLSFVAFLVFYAVCDIKGLELPHLTILGMNPLAIYLVQYSLLEMNGKYIPEDSGVVLGTVAFVLFYLFNYAVARRLARDKIIIKL